MSALLKRTSVCLWGITLALLTIGGASAQDASKQVLSASTTTCVGSQNGTLTLTPVTTVVDFTCTNAGPPPGTDISLASNIGLSTSSTAANPDVLNCPVSFTVKI